MSRYLVGLCLGYWLDRCMTLGYFHLTFIVAAFSVALLIYAIVEDLKHGK